MKLIAYPHWTVEESWLTISPEVLMRYRNRKLVFYITVASTDGRRVTLFCVRDIPLDLPLDVSFSLVMLDKSIVYVESLKLKV